MLHPATPILEKAKDYRSAIKGLLSIEGKSISYSRFVKKTGLQSKGYLSDVLNGKKRITARTLPLFVQALKLSGNHRKLLEYLVYLREPDVRPLHLTQSEIELRIAQFRRRLRTPSKRSPRSAFDTVHMLASYQVFAAFPPSNQKLSIVELCKKSKRSESDVRAGLRLLIDAGVIKESDGLYSCEAGDLDGEGLGRVVSFQKVFLSAAELMKANSHKMDQRPQDLYFFSSFPISSKNVPIFKKKLHQTLLDFLSEHQNDEGDEVKNICLGFF